MDPAIGVRDASGDLIEIHYNVFPGPRPILLAHGFASNSQFNWSDTGWLRAIEEAGRGAITVDLRGHGLSSKSHRRQDYSPTLLAGDLVAVLDAARVDTVDVVGYSMGCRVALALRDMAPTRVRRMVLGGAGTRELFAGWNTAEVEGFLLRDEPVSDALVQSILTIAVSVPGNDPRALLACIIGMAGPPITAPVRVPTLVVAGERDEIASDAHVLATKIGAEFLAVPKRHHFTTVSSRVFKQGALDFLTDEDAGHEDR